MLIFINYASSPSSQSYTTNFTIDLVPNMNVFKDSTVTLSPSQNPAPTSLQLQSFWDGYLPAEAPANSWGYCTGAASTTSITLTSSSAVVGRTVLTTLSSDQTSGTNSQSLTKWNNSTAIRTDDKLLVLYRLNVLRNFRYFDDDFDKRFSSVAV